MLFFLIHVWSEKREFNSSLVVAGIGVQTAEVQSILVPTHHRNGQEPDHVQREELVPAAGWSGVCGRVGVGSSVAEGVVSGARVRGRMRVRVRVRAHACMRARTRVRAVWPLLHNRNVVQSIAQRIAAEFAGWKQKHVVHDGIQRVTCARVEFYVKAFRCRQVPKSQLSNATERQGVSRSIYAHFNVISGILAEVHRKHKRRIGSLCKVNSAG